MPCDVMTQDVKAWSLLIKRPTELAKLKRRIIKKNEPSWADQKAETL